MAEVFWRRLADGVAAPDPFLAPIDQRVARVPGGVAGGRGEGQLGGAVTVALLGTDPDVEHLRWRIGGFIRVRLAGRPSGPTREPRTRCRRPEMLYAGGLVHAGMGHLSYEQTSDRLVAAARMIMEHQQ